MLEEPRAPLGRQLEQPHRVPHRRVVQPQIEQPALTDGHAPLRAQRRKQPHHGPQVPRQRQVFVTVSRRRRGAPAPLLRDLLFGQPHAAHVGLGLRVQHLLAAVCGPAQEPADGGAQFPSVASS